jgi:hypothetical protein
MSFRNRTAREPGLRTRLEPCESWRPYVIAAVPKTVRLATERKTGLEPAVRALSPLAPSASAKAGSIYCAARPDGLKAPRDGAPYVVAAIPGPVNLSRSASERCPTRKR